MLHLSRPLVVAFALPMLFVGVPAAQADGRPCVTGHEYNRIHNGMTKHRVEAIFDTRGTLLFRNSGTVTNMAKEYRSCPGLASRAGDTVQVQFNNYAAHGGPMRVVYIQVYNKR